MMNINKYLWGIKRSEAKTIAQMLIDGTKPSKSSWISSAFNFNIPADELIHYYACDRIFSNYYLMTKTFLAENEHLPLPDDMLNGIKVGLWLEKQCEKFSTQKLTRFEVLLLYDLRRNAKVLQDTGLLPYELLLEKEGLLSDDLMYDLMDHYFMKFKVPNNSESLDLLLNCPPKYKKVINTLTMRAMIL